MTFPLEQPGCHHAECWFYEENKEIVALSSFPQPNLHCHYNCRPVYPMGNDAEDCNMSEYPNNWSELFYTGVNPPLSPQTDPMRESPDLNHSSGRSVPANVDRAHETTSSFDPLQIPPFEFAMSDSLISTQEGYPHGVDWHLAQIQDLPGTSSRNFNASMTPNIWLGEYTLKEVYVSEPESLETSTEPEDQKCLEAIRKPIETVSCKHPGCEKTFRKKTDMDRHFKSIHEGAGFLCGNCENEGTKSPLKRKDHFLSHLHKHHGLEEMTWKSCKKCPWPMCQPANQKQSRLFSTQTSLEKHLLLKHEGKLPESAQRREAGLISLPDAQDVADQENSLAGIKRSHDHETQGSKRPRCGDCASDLQPTHYLHGQRKSPFIVASGSTYSKENAESSATGRPAHALLGCQAIQSEPDAIAEDNETFVLNVSPVDYLALLELSGYKLKTLNKTFLPADPTNNEEQKMPVVSFNTSQRSISLRGPLYVINFYKGFLEKDLEVIRSSRPLVYLDSTTTNRRLGAKDHLRTDFQSPTAPRRSFRNSNKVFAVRKDEDAYLLELWMKKILPSLFKILDDSIGNEYSASLIREGASEQSSIAVVRIESPQVPASTTRDDILQQLDKSCGVILAESGIEVQFSAGSLVLLAGTRQRRNNPNTDDKRELPFHTRYWEYPGMGASIGLLCTEEEFATLGCYVEVDKQKYIMTIDHLIEKSYRKLESGIEDRRTLTSPALAKVKKMNEDLRHLLSSLEGDMAAEMRRMFGDRPISMTDLDPLPKGILEIHRKRNFVSEFVAELKKDKQDFKIGSLVHQCKPNGTARLCTAHSTVASDPSDYSGLDLQPAEMCHRMDWALFKADSRAGTNRHRYRYNHDDGTTDYFPEDKEHGEGDICKETCIVQSNEKVYFVGQTNGRLTGEINAALRAVNYQGRKTLEHHIIITAEQKKKGKEYGGDSGAVVLRISDNKLVGLVWGCFNDEIIFTPIGTVFTDIKETLKANDVRLPKVQEDPTPNEALLISGTESELEWQRPFKSSDIVLPELSEEATEKESRLLAASILESLKSGSMSFFSIAVNSDLSITPKDKPSSPIPSLSSSRSPSPMSMPPSPSPSFRDLPALTNTANDLLVAIQEDDSLPRGRSQNYTTDGEDIEDFFVQMLDIKQKLSIPHLLNKGNQKLLKRVSYPRAQSPKLRRNLGTWPINVRNRWDKLWED